jgi:putative ABC transport system permease protein
MRQDLRYAIRVFARKPLVAGTAAFVLALGIAGATAVFSVVNSVVLRPLPYPDPERLVRLWEITPDGDRFSFSDPNYLDVREQSHAMTEVAAFREVGGHVILADGGEPQRLNVVPVSASLPTVLGVAPRLGRLFTAEEDRPGDLPQPLVLSDEVWRSRFGSDARVIGRKVTLNDLPFEIVGVLPATFDFPRGAEAWIPLAADPSSERDNKELAVIGRLATGATLEQARQELRDIAGRLSTAYPVANGGWSAGAGPFSEWIVAPRYRDAVWVLFGAVGLLLLLACANVASLLLAQAASRRGELRIRAALGAARTRLARQLFVESTLLAAVGTVAGILLAVWSVDLVRLLGGDRIPRLDTVGIDQVVLAFSCLAGMVSCVMFGLAPAIHASRIDLRASLDEGYRYTASGQPLRQGLVVLEVALALLLLVAAGLMANSFVRLMNVDPGFDTASTLAMPVDLPPRRYPGDRTAAFYAELLEQIRAVPGVSAAAATSTNPFREFGFSNSVTPEDRAADAPPSGLVQAGWRSVTPEFFETLRIPVISGRAFTTRDRADAERVIVISESLAARLWPEQSAVGKRIYWGGTTGRTRTVVGVVRDIRDLQLDLDTSAMVFLPHAQVDLPAMTVVVRTPEGLASVAPLLRDVLRRLDPALPAPAIDAIETARVETVAGPRFNLTLLVAFAGIALVLAVTGVYGMLAFSVAERRREIAVRLALGASGTRVARQIVWSGLALTLSGVVVGTAGAMAAARVLTSLLYGVRPTDPLTLAGACFVLLAVAVVACLVPARHAMRLDAMRVLRE